MSYFKVAAVVVVATAIFGVSTAGAQPYQFHNATGDGLWITGGNWTRGEPPLADHAWINVPDAGPAIINTAVPSPAEIIVGQGAGSGHVVVTDGGSISGSHLNMAWGDGRDGTWEQTGGFASVGEVRAGRDGDGGIATISISGGEFHSTAGHVFLGDRNVSTDMTISGGTVTTVGALRLSDRGDAGAFPLSTATSSLTVSGGSLTIGGLLAIGARTAGEEVGTGRGAFAISGDATLTIGANVAMRPGEDNSFTVFGSGPTINVNRPSATGFEVHQDNDVSFIFDEGGISPVTIAALMRWSHADSTLNVDASAFAGTGEFPLFTFAGYFDVEGVPKQFGTENLVFAPGHSGFISYNDTSITLTIEGDPTLPGDFNLDGRVDAADYTVWRDGLGTTHDVAQYDEWKANFGAGAQGGGAVAAAVPEPAALALAVLAVLTLLAAAGRRCG